VILLAKFPALFQQGFELVLKTLEIFSGLFQ
jgi:hypothetical protein